MFKFFHSALTLSLLLILFCFAFGSDILFWCVETRELYLKKQLSKHVYLYEVAYLGNATVSNYYNYYIEDEIEGDPLPFLKKRRPFLSGDNENISISLTRENVSGRDRRLSVKYFGEIYEFHNTKYLPVGSGELWIDLQSIGVSRRDNAMKAVAMRKLDGELSAKPPESVVRIKK
ncbi:hypothetical protein FAI41_02505 [Acetobacteraceae bacterium]|nr:hypothetical protein FAI41_02505 [Acetobacteraceae bacterium]